MALYVLDELDQRDGADRGMAPPAAGRSDELAVPATGTVVGGRWRLGESIGRGATASVFAAEDLTTGRPAAVKVVRPDTPDVEQRFVREVGILRSLQHPAVVAVLDDGVEPWGRYVVLERIDGGSLDGMLGTGVLAPGRVAQLGVALASGLAAAHQLGIVHRDIKPANVLLGTDGFPRLADYGVALVAGADRFTATGWSVGTMSYLAPEQARGEAVGPAADVFSLGLVLLECLTGQRAYDGTSLASLVGRLDRRPDIPDSIPPRLRAALAAMTSLDPASRPSAADAAELLGLAGPTGADATDRIPIPADAIATAPVPVTTG